MKVCSALLAVILTATTAFVSFDAHAKRLGGGQSVGKQSSNVTKREAAPAQPSPAQASPASPAQQPAAAPAAAAAQKKPWGAMLGGLAAGLGLAWLAHSLGFGEGLAQFLMFMLLALAVMVVVGLVLRKLRSGRQSPSASPFAMQGAGAPSVPQYSPSHVGNDASARPWERQNANFDASAPAATGSMIGSALAGSQSSWGVPADFDVAGFLGAAKANFVSLQGAWDRADIAALRAMMTDEMLAQIQAQLAERESHTGGAVNLTEVLSLDAKLLGIEELEDVYMASVEFSGMIREDQSAGPSPFREVWNMTKPRHRAGGWLVAGVQALQ